MALVPFGTSIGHLLAWRTRREVHGPKGYVRKPGRPTVVTTRDGVRVRLRLHDVFVRKQLRKFRAKQLAAHPDRAKSYVASVFRTVQRDLLDFVAIEVEWYRDVGATMPRLLQDAVHWLDKDTATTTQRRTDAWQLWALDALGKGELRIDTLQLLCGLTGQHLAPLLPRKVTVQMALTRALNQLARRGRVTQRRLTTAERKAIGRRCPPTWAWRLVSQKDQT